MLNKKSYSWDNLWLPFLLLVTAALTMMPFCRIGFTSADDLEYYTTLLRGNFWTDATIYAKYSGRFYFLITKPLYSLPYIFDNFVVTKIFEIGALLFSFGAFAAMILHIFKNRNLTLATFVALLFFTPVTSNLHIPFIAYPFFFCISFGLSCLAVIAFLRYTETQQYRHVVISAVLFLITTLFYETYLVFVALFCLFVLLRNLYLHGIKNIWGKRSFYKEILPFVLVAILYIGAYFIFRMFVNNEYDGSSFATHFSLANAWRVMSRCTKIMFPCQTLKLSEVQTVLGHNSLLYTGHYNNLWFMLTHASPIVYVNAALQLFIIGYLLRHYDNKLSYKALFITLGSAVCFALLSHILIAISEKYNAVWSSWIIGYVTSYYAYFGVILAILAATCLLLKVTSVQHYLHQAACLLIIAISAVLLVLTGYNNDNLSREWQRIQMSYNAVTEMIDQHAFDQIRDNDILFYPDMYQSGEWGYTLYGDDRNEWTYYINLKTLRGLQGCRTVDKLKAMLENDSTARVFYLSKMESNVHNELLLSLSEVDKNTLDLTSETPMRTAECQQTTLYYYSPCKEFSLGIQHFGQDTTSLTLNHKDTLSLTPGWNMLNISYPYYQSKRKCPLAIIHLSGKRIAADGIRIFNMQHPQDTVYTIALEQ